jgi:hypothetical protein
MNKKERVAKVKSILLPRSDFYILEDRIPVPVPMEDWAERYENRRLWRVAETIEHDVRVSTVFLGMDHRFGDGPPLLFETMTFKAGDERDQRRCSTWDQAEKMHARACKLAGISWKKP